MEAQNRKINRGLMVGWTIIVMVLFVSYIGEYLKGVRSGGYVAAFLLCTILPNVYCHIRYRKAPDSGTLPYYIVPCYFVMYLFSLITGSTNMVFSYILPLLSLLILTHKPKLILWTGIASLIANSYFIAMQFVRGQINMSNSKDIEIQIALIVLCFGGCYMAAVIYDEISRQNVIFFEELQKKNEQNRQMTFQTIKTIVNTIDAKDEYTKGHSQRVSEYSGILAQKLGMGSEEAERIRYIALLHDIGKIGVPDAILNKAGRLSNEEFELMKQHTLLGGDILKDINAVKDIDVGAKYHHERFDGKGYPEGLCGEEIPYVARIICVADAYDAMTSNRIYRNRLSDEAVEQEIRRCGGTQFDPKMAQVFADLLRSGELHPISHDAYISPAASKKMADQVLKKVLESAGIRNSSRREFDLLTSVYTKTYGETLLDDYLKKGTGSLLSIDLDALRDVNGHYGYVHGDMYINIVAHLLRDFCDNKILYRSGGDEFVCFLCGVTEPSIVEQEVEEIYRLLEEQKREDALLRELSISIGILIAKKQGRDREELIDKADRALYFAKQRRIGKFCMYHDLQKELQQNLSKLDLDNLIRTIQSEGEYTNAYQVNYPEFAKMVNYIRKVVARNCQKMQIIMFTVLPMDEESATVEQRLEAMDTLQFAVVNSLRSVDVTMQFSSSQRIVILMNMEDKDIQLVTQRISSAFYKGNMDKNFSIYYDVADLTM